MEIKHLHAALKAAQETVKHLTELIEAQNPEPNTFESFTIYPISKEQYPEVKRLLEGLGYDLYVKEWNKGQDCVTTNTIGYYMTHEYSWLKWLNETTYTFTEFMTKYSK